MKPAIKIGRDDTNDIVINEPRVSRNHAIITFIGDGTFEIKDLSSANGTFVNGKKIDSQVITPDDKVEVGTCLVNWYPAFIEETPEHSNSIIREEPFSRIRKTLTVGSAGDCDLRIANRFVSAHHARISLLKNGEFYLEDLSSSNGTFINGSRISTKNFSRTDIVKVGSADLPQNWFRHKKLRKNLFQDHKKSWIVMIIFILLTGGSVVCYFNRCEWFNHGCNLTAEQIYLQNKNSLVHIVHSYYYKINFKGRSYFVGKNNLFKVTEANTSKENLLPYGSVSGSGCFIKEDGTILTSATIVSPWLYGKEKDRMIDEVYASRTIDKFSPDKEHEVCGETAELQWLANSLVNNPQNYISATAEKSCRYEENKITIRSVKNEIPENANIIGFYYDSTTENHLNNTPAYYYSVIKDLRTDIALQDTFYAIKDSSDINKMDVAPISRRLPGLVEGSIVLNERGELVGNIQNNTLQYIHRYYKQLKNH
jgi:pSer/pThr/pTyr-binding forkhead associated (FHA) protein